MSKPVLTVQNLTKQYRAGKRVLEDVSITFEPGRAVVLKGANGSGKTTFLRLLSANSYPTSGSVRYGDLNIHENPYQYLKHVGLVHDEEGLPLYLSAAELLEWLLRSRRQWSDRTEKRVHELLDRLELDDSRYEEIGTYSTGMRKKAQIAAALCTDPDVLILDEPLRGLDVSSRDRALGLFTSAVERGAILLMATHSESEKDGRFGTVLQFPIEKGDL